MKKLICPNCGVYTAFSAFSIAGKGLLGESSREDRLVFGNVSIPAICRYESGQPTYAILVCQACDKRFIAQQDIHDRWSAVFPIQHKVVAEEIPEPIKGEFEEASLCLSIGAYIGCLLVCKTVLISTQRQQGVSTMKELMEKGTISKILYQQADQVRLWGNLVGHEDIIPEEITKEDCEQLLTYLEALLDAIYVQPIHLSSITEKLDKLKKKDKPEKE